MSFPDFSDGPPPDKDWDTFWEELKRGGQIRFDTRHRRKDGWPSAWQDASLT